MKKPYKKEGEFVIGPNGYCVEASGALGSMLARDLNAAYARGARDEALREKAAPLETRCKWHGHYTEMCPLCGALV